LLSGLLSCVFGILGIFTWGLIFVPLAAVCSLVGLLRGSAGLSISGIGCSLLGAVLTAWGFVVSPSLWLLPGWAFSHPISQRSNNHSRRQPELTPPEARRRRQRIATSKNLRFWLSCNRSYRESIDLTGRQMP
jgi:hypothetical protein